MSQDNPKVSVPVSQDEKKIQVATRQECIDHLLDMVKQDTTRFITRNAFRNESDLAESAWTEHFGTWQEFKRQAQVMPSRHVAAHEKAIAKHAASDGYRALNSERMGWGEAYLRPDASRFVTDIVVTDVHDVECDPFWRRVVMDSIARVQPRRVVIGGDLFDLPEFGKYGVDPREWDVVGRIKWAHEFLADMRAAAPNAELVFVEGNHEHRLLRHLAEASPAMRSILADLHGWTVPKLLGLEQFEVNYIARADLGTFTQRDSREEMNRNYYVAPDHQYLIHHFPQGRNMKLPGAHGHHHRHHVWQEFSPTYGAYEWHQLGSGHRRTASYCAGEQWGMGFLMLHVDQMKNHVAHEYIQVRDHAVVGGKWFQRSAAEV